MTRINHEKTVSERCAPRMGMRAMDVTLCGLFAALISVGAFIKIEIPIQPYPMHFTMQWFFVLLAGLLLGSRRAAMSVSVYLLVGLVGVPVFASGGGPAYLLRPTFGFLLGFDLAALLMGWMMERSKKGSFRQLMTASLAGLAAYYLMGMVYFYFISNYVIFMPVGWKIVLINCCLLTIFEDFLLCVLAVLVCVRIRPGFQRMLSNNR